MSNTYRLANNVDPNQTALKEQFDLGSSLFAQISKYVSKILKFYQYVFQMSLTFNNFIWVGSLDLT